jgi:hypothetical protein
MANRSRFGVSTAGVPLIETPGCYRDGGQTIRP